EVLQHLLGLLGRGPADELAAVRIERDLAGAEQQVAGADRLAVGTDRRRSGRGRDGFELHGEGGVGRRRSRSRRSTAGGRKLLTSPPLRTISRISDDDT